MYQRGSWLRNTVAVTVLVALIGGCALAVTLASDGSMTNAEVITAIAAVLAFCGAAYAIFDNRGTARQRVTYEYIARLEAPELIEHQALMSSFLRGGLRPPKTSDEEWADIEKDEQARCAAAAGLWTELSESASVDDRKTVMQILAYPNMLEGLAGMYNHGLLDPRIVKVEVGSEAESFWARGTNSKKRTATPSETSR